MKLLAATVMSLFLLASAFAQTNQAGADSGSGAPPVASSEDSQTISITRSGSQPSARDRPSILLVPCVSIPHSGERPVTHVGARIVTFEPGARTAWHTHPLGQTLIVTAGPAGSSNGVVKFRKSGKAMLYGFRRASNTGMEPRQRRE